MQAVCSEFLQGEGCRVVGPGAAGVGGGTLWPLVVGELVQGDPSKPHLHLHPRVLAESLTRLWLSLSASLTRTCSRLGAPVQIQGYCQAVGTVNLPHSFIHDLTSADSAEEKQTLPNPRGLQQSGSLFSAPPQSTPGATGQEKRATVLDVGGSPPP